MPKKLSDDERYEAFLAKVVQTPSGCWLWTGALAGGYGRFRWAGRSIKPAHVVAYWYWKGDIPDGLQLDHLCHTKDESCPGGPSCLHRRCVNPAHLEPVSRLENARRGRGNQWGRPTCLRGHPFDRRWRDGRGVLVRKCSQCASEYERKYRMKSQAG